MSIKIFHDNLCFVLRSNPSCIDLFLISNALYFQSNKTVSTGSSDFHKSVLTVLKVNVVKIKLREVQYANYK